LGLTPVFVDIDPKTYNMDPSKVEEAITSRTKAILPVSLYGQIPDMKALKEVASRHKLPIIEDAAQSFGATYFGQKSCALSDIGCTSFFPAKPLGTYGDGGAVFTNNSELYDRMAQIRNHGQTTRYNHVRIGFNGRLDTLQCAILKVKLGRYEWEMKRRQEIAAAYSECLKDVENITLPYVADGCESVWAQYTIRVNDRDRLQAALSERGVPTAVHYPKPMHLQPIFKGIEIRHDLTQSEKAAEEVLSLPLYADMPAEHVAYVIKTLKECL
jgi:UDP-2-acetamido-2-deoxy-ribo-hexuluronate aminotransferase